ncbi:hypothetical protein IV64_GL002169 [Lactiplantibacillus xiangfangensis]|uniref:Extracellular small neutral protease n=2 Tax=Lactiplantibacillus xiangfangensis TaxID=942150 RepID=A0A0R2MJX6_9LACO|nr:hypothetical protein IV64_GL002169 [Lactiplantibacillus xiangfangensis]
MAYAPSQSSSQLRQAISNAAAFWNKAAGKTIVQITNDAKDADVTYAQYSDSNLGGYAQTDYILRVTAINAATFDTSKQAAWDDIVAHEMGHALGLGHADAGGANLTDIMAGDKGQRSVYKGLGSPTSYDKSAMNIASTDFIATYNDSNEQLNGDLPNDSYKIDGLKTFFDSVIAYAKAHNWNYPDYLSMAQKLDDKLGTHNHFGAVMDNSATPDYLNLVESTAARIAVTSGYLPANPQLTKYMNMTVKMPVYFVSSEESATGLPQVLGISSFNSVYDSSHGTSTMEPVTLPTFKGYKPQAKASIGILDLLDNNSSQIKYVPDSTTQKAPILNVNQYGSARNGTLVFKLR